VGKDVEMDSYETALPAFDPVGATNHPHLWHRGYPLQLVPARDYSKKLRKTVHVDCAGRTFLERRSGHRTAFCRMEHAPECDFDSAGVPMCANKMGPCNSQNTFIAGACLKDYFSVSARRADGRYLGLVLLAGQGLPRPCGIRRSVYQRRNVHDLVRDMRQEYPGYENNLNLVQDLARDPQSIAAYLPGKSSWALNSTGGNFQRA